MKKVQDHYFKKAKKEGFPARSVYKLEEAQQKYRLLKKGDTVLDLGCMPGSWSLYASKIIGPTGLVVGVDISKGNINPPAGGAAIQVICADIMEADTIGQVTAISGKYRVILSDMAPKTTGNKWADQQHSLTLARRVLEIAEQLLAADGNFYCKVFEGEDFKEFVDTVRRQFKMTKIVKPKSSRSESREVFVLGMGFLHQPDAGTEI